MNWLKGQIGWILTAIVMLTGAAMAFGRMQTRTETIYAVLAEKADKAAVTRELDQIQATLERIEHKLDQHMQK
jgi:hypothetical protein